MAAQPSWTSLHGGVVHSDVPDTDPLAGNPVDARIPRLIGVTVSPDSRTAVFAGTTGGKAVVVPEGGQVSGLAVQSIRPGEAAPAGP